MRDAMVHLAVRMWLWLRGWLAARWRVLRARPEAGMTTAEYAVGTLAAVAFAVVLLAVVRSDAVRNGIAEIIGRALRSGG